MIKKFIYSILGISVISLDAITKHLAVLYCAPVCSINDYLSFIVRGNRGVAWSLFATDNNMLFALLTLIIIGITIGLMAHAINRYSDGYAIWGETLAIAGSAGNIFDRIVFGSVIDFIEFSYGSFVWPTFNIADVAIVCGIGMMLYQNVINEK